MSKIAVEKIHTLEGHRDAIYALTHSNDSSSFYSSGGDGLVVQWNYNLSTDGDLVVKVPNSVYALAYSNNQLIVGHNYDGVHIIDLTTKKEIKSIHLGDAAIFDIKIANNLIYVGMGSGELVVISAIDFTIKFRKFFAQDRIRKILLHDELILLACSDNEIKVLDRNFKLINNWQAHSKSVSSLAIFNDKLFSVGRDAKIKVWNLVDNFSLFHEIPAHLYAINDLSFSPNKKYFATCSIDKTIKVWDSEKMRLLKVIDKQRMAGHGTSVNKIFWENDSQIVSCSDDRTLSVWQIKE